MCHCSGHFFLHHMWSSLWFKSWRNNQGLWEGLACFKAAKRSQSSVAQLQRQTLKLTLRSGLFCFEQPDTQPKRGFRGLFTAAGSQAAERRCQQKTKSIDRAGLKCGINRSGIYCEAAAGLCDSVLCISVWWVCACLCVHLCDECVNVIIHVMTLQETELMCLLLVWTKAAAFKVLNGVKCSWQFAFFEKHSAVKQMLPFKDI